MNRRIFPVFVVVCLVIGILTTPSAKSQNLLLGFILIKQDGSVEPSSAPIQRVGNVYTITDNLNKPIVIERGQITIDGAGHRLDRNSNTPNVTSIDSGVGINLTCSNVTVRNIYISNWNTGILGVYDTNKITNTSITGCYNGVSVYGNDYDIEWNYIANNLFKGINLRANHTTISHNEIAGEQDGINISYSDHIITENNMSNVGYDITGTGIGGVVIYRNNFFKTNPNRYLFVGSSTAVWDNGKEGNFWSRYNGTDANGDGIGDTPYSIGQFFTYTTTVGKNASGSRIWGVDNYPLMNPVVVEESPPPPSTPSPTSTPTPPQATSSPNLTPLTSPPVSQSATPTILPTALQTSTPSPTIPEFPSWIMLILIFAATLLTILGSFERRRGKLGEQNPIR